MQEIKIIERARKEKKGRKEKRDPNKFLGGLFIDFNDPEEKESYENLIMEPRQKTLLITFVAFYILLGFNMTYRLLINPDDLVWEQIYVSIALMVLALGLLILSRYKKNASEHGLFVMSIIVVIFLPESVELDKRNEKTIYHPKTALIFGVIPQVFLELMMLSKIRLVYRLISVSVFHGYILGRLEYDEFVITKYCNIPRNLGVMLVTFVVQYSFDYYDKAMYHKIFQTNISLENFKTLVNEIFPSPLVILGKNGRDELFANTSAKKVFNADKGNIVEKIRNIDVYQQAPI